MNLNAGTGWLPKPSVVIRALNEEASLPQVITRLQPLGLKRICVMDKGSYDHTPEIARQCGAEVISERKRGYGQACWTGCNCLPPDVEWILFCNADGSDDIQRVPALLTATESGAEFILWKRTTGSDGQDHRTTSQSIGNKFAVALIRLLWGAKYADLGSLRLISRRAFERMNLQDRFLVGRWKCRFGLRRKVCASPERRCETSSALGCV